MAGNVGIVAATTNKLKHVLITVHELQLLTDPCQVDCIGEGTNAESGAYNFLEGH